MDGVTDEHDAAVGNPSRARDHMANERTYLAWLRTGATVMALGLAITTFGNTTTIASVIAGGLLVATGAAGVVFGTVRYRHVNTQLEDGRYVTGSRRRAAVLASTVLVAAIVIALVLLVVGR